MIKVHPNQILFVIDAFVSHPQLFTCLNQAGDLSLQFTSPFRGAMPPVVMAASIPANPPFGKPMTEFKWA
ncbi:hypothetical protein AT705_20545 [Pseudoalteromonas rubra]|uniref:Uncharacterized protein n=1 Tax=Pseudoalteromonas rubra TaxID=43658 RepID=A0A0U2ZC37_9GAMM|nr:hypothetical protein AT705_20545 [Pseudoalteromonas rubra]